MIVSRVLPTLIKLNQVNKLTTITKSRLLNPRYCIIKVCPGTLTVFDVKTMSTDVDKELKDPKRHFDYNQLLAKKDQENVVIIDVREHSEINETGKIPGSIHIPLNDLKQALTSLTKEEFLKLYDSGKPKTDDEIIFTCRSVAELGKALGEMTEEEFKKQYSADKPQKDVEVIFSCKAGGRSLKALKLGLELGYNKAGNYKGGWLDWAEKTGISN